MSKLNKLQDIDIQGVCASIPEGLARSKLESRSSTEEVTSR